MAPLWVYHPPRRTRRGPQDSCGPPHRLQLPETSVLLLAGSGQERRDGGKRGGSQGDSREHRHTDMGVEDRQGQPAGGEEEGGSRETKAPPAIRLLCPRTDQGCPSGSNPPCSLGLVQSWADTGVSEGEGA